MTLSFIKTYSFDKYLIINDYCTKDCKFKRKRVIKNCLYTAFMRLRIDYCLPFIYYRAF